ncbi:MAG: SsrA-binding protein SmpB [Planctomycetia bacterium]|jgi:SsrA-binding protein|nr:SsrA-binding protein SmpB [Planctomycetia bacterium]MBL6914651.1 SsrA-binding protein SmpB [Planctomycetota bacterium]NCF56084.1 SsrA-binding protein SmpB [Planctomycetia bacterium]NCG11791.1 SsrA-binding protein SmpB [Planctomycetia bacterium]HCW45398.1 SsrA-binding protein [Planctomycetota bacterium]
MKIVAQNRKARFELEILDTLEAGIVLQGSEVKSLRAGECEMVDGFVRIESGEAYMHKVRIAEYSHGGYSNHEPTRKRKLLIHKREANQLRVKIEEKGLTIVPLKIYFNAKGKVKVDLAIGRGKKAHDKRRATKDREAKREVDRELKHRR